MRSDHSSHDNLHPADARGGARSHRAEGNPPKVVGDELPLNADGELQLPDELAHLASKLSDEAAGLGGQAERWRRETRDPPEPGIAGRRWLGQLRATLVASGTCAGLLALLWLIWVAVAPSAAPLGIVESAGPPPNDSVADAANDPSSPDDAQRPPSHGRLDTSKILVEEGENSRWNQDPFVSHLLPDATDESGQDSGQTPASFLEELSGPELEGWMDLQQQKDSSPTRISI